jgi:hypothetical protein
MRTEPAPRLFAQALDSIVTDTLQQPIDRISLIRLAPIDQILQRRNRFAAPV